MPEPPAAASPPVPDALGGGFSVSPWVARRLGAHPAAMPPPSWWLPAPGAAATTALVPAAQAAVAFSALPAAGAAPLALWRPAPARGLHRLLLRLRFRRVMVATERRRYRGLVLAVGPGVLTLAGRGGRLRWIALDRIVWIRRL